MTIRPLTVAERLAIRAQRGDKRALEQCLTEMRGLVHKESRRWFVRGMDEDDLAQVARIALVRAILRFDPARGALTTIAVRNMRRDLDHQYDKVRRVKRGGDAVRSAELGDESLEARRELVGDMDEPVDPADTERDVIACDQAERILRTLSPKARRAAVLLMTGHTYEQAARVTETRQQGVYSLMRSSRERLERAGLAPTS